MRSDSSRWLEVTPSEFAHEREGLTHVRDRLPDRAPFRAWSNLEFKDEQGRWYEVDLLVLGEGRLHLVELKHYGGRIGGNAYHWRRNKHSLDSPLLLAEKKAKRLRSLIQRKARELGADARTVPFIQQCVFLHHADTRCELPAGDRRDLFGLDGTERRSGLPGIMSRLLEPADSDRPVLASDDGLAELFDRIGFSVRREREVGSWRLTGPALAEGEGWQDWPAEHRHVHGQRAKIRFFVHRAGTPAPVVSATSAAVAREYELTRSLRHDGLLAPHDLVDHDLGQGLVYDHDPAWRPLDLWLADRADPLPVTAQVDMIEQLTEALGYAHRNHVVHRGLCPRAISVDPATTTVKLADWQSAGRDEPAAGSQPTSAGATRLARALGENGLIDPSAAQNEAYIAPEGRFDPGADRVRLDVFALGAVCYHLVTGRPPAQDWNAMRERVGREGGLDPFGDAPEILPALRLLVVAATRPVVTERLADLGQFRDMLQAVRAQVAGLGGDGQPDPLDAPPQTLLGGRFELLSRLGSGSTAVGLLVRDHGTNERLVLKVALDESAARRLEGEAETLRALQAHRHPRIVTLAEDHVVRVGQRSALLLEHAGEQTLADELHASGRLTIDLLERWGIDLLDALVALDKAGVDHRDIKPANLGVRQQPADRAKHLMLFDFSLARAAVDSIDVGTPRYRDPFLGVGTRLTWDSAAERYAAAATLHEMATGRVPRFGDGQTHPSVLSDEADIDPAQFDYGVADGLTAFFRRALRREATERHHTAAEMLAAWRAAFTTIAAPPDPEHLAEAATLDTTLERSGLSARALSAIEPLGVATVRDLLRLDPVRLSRLPRVAVATKREIGSLAKQWRQRLLSAPQPSTVDGPLADPAGTATSLVEAAGTRRQSVGRQTAQVLLGVTGEVGGFATTAALGEQFDVTAAAVSIRLGNLQEAWARDEDAVARLDAIAGLALDALSGQGGLATSDVLVRLLCPQANDPEVTTRLVEGLLRAALDRAEQAAFVSAEDPRIVRRRRRRDGRVLLATGARLLDVADRLTAVADGLVTEATDAGDDYVPVGTAAAALRECWPESVAPVDDLRLVRLAGALSPRVGASRRGELHARDLPPSAAVRIALGGVASEQQLEPAELLQRVRARFPDLPVLPGLPELARIVADSGVSLVQRGGGFVAPPRPTPPSTSLTSYVPLLLRADGQRPEDAVLTRSIRERSFLAVTTSDRWQDQCRDELVDRFGVAVVDVSGVLIAALRDEATAAGIGWDQVRAADAAEPGSRPAQGLAALVARAVPAVTRAVEEADPAAPAVLLVDAAPLVRYDHTDVLARYADMTIARPRAVWLLAPAGSDSDVTRPPRLDSIPVPLAHSDQFLWLGARPTDKEKETSV